MPLITKIIGGSQDITPTSEPTMPNGFEGAKIGAAESVHETEELRTLITNVLYGVTDGATEGKARPVTIQAHYIHHRHGEHYVAGYCHLSEAFIGLSIEPESQLVNLRSGEVYANPIEHLTHYYVAAYNSDDADISLFKTIISHCKQELDILGFMGWADGQFDDCEKLVALQFLKACYSNPPSLLAEEMARVNAPSVMSDALEQLLAQHIHKLSPNAHDFSDAVRAISSDEDRTSLLSSFLGRMMLADGVASPEEIELLRVLQPIAG